jgi:hypothetical protein
LGSKLENLDPHFFKNRAYLGRVGAVCLGGVTADLKGLSGHPHKIFFTVWKGLDEEYLEWYNVLQHSLLPPSGDSGDRSTSRTLFPFIQNMLGQLGSGHI